MKHLTSCIVILILAAACNQHRKPAITYDHTQNNVDSTYINSVNDSTQILVAELPIKFDSTDILIFPIGLVELEKRRGGYSKISFASSGSTNVSSGYYFSSDELTGNLVNLVFHDQQEEERKLTNKKIKIRSVRFLREFSKKNKYLLYFISDQDTNGDKTIDQSDLESIYLSRIDGTDFKKISQPQHEFYDYTIIKSENTIYFRTIEDQNEDGELNGKDRFHYFTISFSSENYRVEEINPLKAL